jgi:hypothetical protein
VGVALIGCAAALALVPSILSGDSLASLDGRSRLAFALVPWLLLAGLPRRIPLNAGLALGLALPICALAGWLDARGGIAAGELWQRAAWALACAALVHAAARKARGASRYGAAWFLTWLVVPGFAALVTAFAAGTGGVWTDRAAALGAPSRALAVAADGQLAPPDALAFVTAALLFAVAARVRKRTES